MERNMGSSETPRGDVIPCGAMFRHSFSRNRPWRLQYQ